MHFSMAQAGHLGWAGDREAQREEGAAWDTQACPSPRHWQDLGYLIIYVTGRPDMQKQRVVAWLAQHNFPHGVVSFCDGLVHDPLRHKANFLKLLISEVGPERGSGRAREQRAVPTPTPVSPTAAPARTRSLRLYEGRGGLQLHQPVPHADLHCGAAHQEAAAAVPGEWEN